MLFVVFFVNDDPLLTIGDAVASFLDERDLVTFSSGLVKLHDFKPTYKLAARPWDGNLYRWKDATLPLRRRLFFTSYVIRAYS